MILAAPGLRVGTRFGWPGVRLAHPGLRGLGQSSAYPFAAQEASTGPDPRSVTDYSTVVHSGLVNLPGGGTAQASVTNGDLYGALALMWGTSKSQAEAQCGAASNGGVPVGNINGSGGCSGYLATALRYLQSGYYAFDPSTRTWARSQQYIPPPNSQQAVQAAPATGATMPQGTQTSVQAATGATTPLVSGTTATGSGFVNFLEGSMIGGIPNWLLLGGGAVVLFFVFQQHGRR
jgi:hypothetical protein